MARVLGIPTFQGILNKARVLLPINGENLRESRAGANVGEGEGRADNTNLIQRLVAWEHGELSDSETVAFFQQLVSSGLAWKTTGPAHRTAVR